MKYLSEVQTSVTHHSCLLNMFYSTPQGIRASFPIPSASWSSPSVNCACWSVTDYCLSVWMWSLLVNGGFTLRGKKWAKDLETPVVHQGCLLFYPPPPSLLYVKVGMLECCSYRSDIKTHQLCLNHKSRCCFLLHCSCTKHISIIYQWLQMGIENGDGMLI